MYLFRALQRRSFVSTLLLSRTWESVTVVELRKEAKARGLSTKGNKSTLIARIQEHEKDAASLPTHTRRGSTAQSAAGSKNTLQAVSPGIPPAVQPRGSTNPNFFAIKLPNLAKPPVNVPIQVPYEPDFWNSARPKADAPAEPELELPKLHVVSGSVTHYDGGPTHNLEKLQGGDSPTVVQVDVPPVSEENGFWADFCESIGLPRSFSFRRSLSKAGSTATQAGENEYNAYSRPLTDEERKGLYILLGIVGGSWLVGWLMNRPTAIAGEHDAQNQY